MVQEPDGECPDQTLLAEKVQLIELCGGFGPIGMAAVLAAINNAVPVGSVGSVGSVGYGPEPIDALHQLFSD